MLHELKNNITKELSTLKLNKKKDIIDYEMLPMSKSKLYTIKENDDEFDDYVKSLVDSMQILKFNVKLNHTNEEKTRTLSPLSKPTATTKFRLKLRLNDRFKKKVVRFKE
jgi:hypothetical protein